MSNGPVGRFARRAPLTAGNPVDLFTVGTRVSPVSFIRKQLESWRRWNESVAMAKRFHAESRSRIAQLSAEGRSQVALEENARLYGTTSAERARIVSFKGVRV
jgi:hypothetical protein